MNKTKAIVFFGIIFVGLIISFLVLSKFSRQIELPPEDGGKEKVTSTGTPVSGAKQAHPQKPNGTTGGKPVAEKQKPSSPGKAGQKQTAAAKPGMADLKSMTTPKALMTALSKGVAARDYDGFLKAVGEKAVPEAIRPRLKSVIENPGLVLDAKQPFSEISKSAVALRWAINLVPGTGNASAQQIYTDIKKLENSTFEVIKVGFPLDLTEAAATAPKKMSTGKVDVSKPKTGSSPVGSTPAAGKKAPGPDALTVAHAFSKAVVAKEFKAARALSDPGSVTDERVTALMMAIEDGEFSLKKERPLIVTLSRDDITWVLTRLNSKEQASEFALELGKVGDVWKVNGLTFSKVIASLAEKAGGGNTAYTPFVKNPGGGDSLVLYFDFDSAGVTPRTARQLGIVARILKGDPARKIVISGYADALGSDDYNEKLSDNRAASIRSSLIAQGARPEQIITKAYGESKPLSPNFKPDGSDNPEGRSRNRRAEVYLDF